MSMWLSLRYSSRSTQSLKPHLTLPRIKVVASPEEIVISSVCAHDSPEREDHRATQARAPVIGAIFGALVIVTTAPDLESNAVCILAPALLLLCLIAELVVTIVKLHPLPPPLLFPVVV